MCNFFLQKYKHIVYIFSRIPLLFIIKVLKQIWKVSWQNYKSPKSPKPSDILCVAYMIATITMANLDSVPTKGQAQF